MDGCGTNRKLRGIGETEGNAMGTRVDVREEVSESNEHSWTLCFQQVTYNYEDGTKQDGYRFIWKRPDGTLQAARGQARIPDAAILDRLTQEAKSKGWLK